MIGAMIIDNYLQYGAIMSKCPDSLSKHSHAYYPPSVCEYIFRMRCGSCPSVMLAHMASKGLVWITKRELAVIEREAEIKVTEIGYVIHIDHDCLPITAVSFSM